VDVRYLNPWSDFAVVKEIWNELYKESKASYFQSWGWIENWIDSLQNLKVQLILVVIYDDSNPVCTFFLGSQIKSRRKLLKIKSHYINATGIDYYDDICIEFNSILCKPKFYVSLQDICKIVPKEWDEIIIPALESEKFSDIYRNGQDCKYNIIIDIDELAPYVNLEEVRKASGGYISLLGSRFRSYIRKSYRAYEKYGLINLIDAQDKKYAIEIYDELVKLHQKSWTAKGHPGAFSSEYFYNFHKQLITNRFSFGEVQLLKISSGSETLGCMYNFIYNGKVYFYQSGINYMLEKAAKPGLVCFCEAINYNAKLNHLIFDFMAGGFDYKQRLAKNMNRLVWVRIQKPLLKFKIEEKVKILYSYIKSIYGTCQNIFSKSIRY
jgi:hypothetical protein